MMDKSKTPLTHLVSCRYLTLYRGVLDSRSRDSKGAGGGDGRRTQHDTVAQPVGAAGSCDGAPHGAGAGEGAGTRSDQGDACSGDGGRRRGCTPHGGHGYGWDGTLPACSVKVVTESRKG
jgi:hypothetical protein